MSCNISSISLIVYQGQNNKKIKNVFTQNVSSISRGVKNILKLNKHRTFNGLKKIKKNLYSTSTHCLNIKILY